MELQGLRTAVEPIIRKAGEIILSYRFKQLKRVEKKEAGFVTEADTATENFLIKELALIEPGVAFFAEENGQIASKSDYCWVIDPLDGTTNFSYGVPHFCISVALTYKNRPVLGMVYQPLLNEFFMAERGAGAWLNGQRIQVSKVATLEESFLLFCIPYRKNPEAQKLMSNVLFLGQHAYSLRLLGAAALDQAYVAGGRFDGVFFEQLSWWDVAAGSLIIEEAGGVVTDYQGNALTPAFTTFVAGNPHIHKLLVAQLGR